MVAALPGEGAVEVRGMVQFETHAALLLTALHCLRQWWLAERSKSLGKSLGLLLGAGSLGSYQGITLGGQL